MFFSPFPLYCFFLSALPSFFFISSSFHYLLFYSFFLSSIIYVFILIFVKIPSYLSSDLFYSFFLPSDHTSIPFLFPFSFLPFYFFFLLSPFPTGETIKPGVLKRPEAEPVRPISISSRPVRSGD